MKTQARNQTESPPVVLATPIIFAEAVKNKKGDVIRVQLKTYEGHNLVDIRNWWPGDDGLRPGKGFACGVRHLPMLARAVSDALAKARELGLVEAGD